MARFVWTAKDQFGKSVVREVPADTVEEAEAALLAEGCTALALQMDEIMDAAHAAFVEERRKSGREVWITPEQRLQALGKRRGSAWQVLGKILWQGKWFYLVVLPLAGYEVLGGQWTGALALIFSIVFSFAYGVWLRLPSIFHRRLTQASDWHRWGEALALIGKLWRWQRYHSIKIPAVHLALAQSQALVAQGKLALALKEFEQYRDQPGCPSWLYYGQVAEIYDRAKQHDTAIDYVHQSLGVKPTSAYYLGLANRLLYYKRDSVRAAEALEAVEKTPLAELLKPMLQRCRGVLAYLQADYATARRELEVLSP